ncbi:arylsulfatase [Penicillium canariense]|uniref:Arylsulfatase n=1 Tax=Penicillium canariense TaxID=189055 RepID=A0A9W9LU36_9EURO|nr:arylsulfatase [Penicillium canariense]KAJ5175774.1 arylsulfatase [Penicillium canariense]
MRGSRAWRRGMYNGGPNELRLRDLHKLKELCLIARDVEPQPVVAMKYRSGPRGSFVEGQIIPRCEKNAGMVERMDWSICHGFDYLEAPGELDSTCVIFMSDNGTEGACMSYKRAQSSVTDTFSCLVYV